MRETPVTNAGQHWSARFFSIWVGQRLSLLGSRIGSFALVWWLTETTGSAIVLTTSSMAVLVPAIILSPFIGSLVDRLNRRIVILVSDATIALLSLWLAYLFWTDALEIWHVYLILVGRAMGGLFHSPAMLASTTLMVPRRHLARISGLNMSMQGVNDIMGPPLGALALALLPLHGVMLVDVVTAICAIAPLILLRIPQPAASSKDRVTLRSVVSDTKIGFRFILKWKGLVALLGLLFIMKVFVMPARTLMPLLVFEHYGRGAVELAWLQAVMGVGIIGGGLILGAWGGFYRKILMILLGTAGIGVGTLLMGTAPVNWFWMVLAGQSLAGVMRSVANSPFTALTQSTVPPEMQGRFFATFGSLSALSTPLGLAIAGPVCEWLGVDFWYQLTGVICVLVAVGALFVRPLMNIEQNQHE